MKLSVEGETQSKKSGKRRSVKGRKVSMGSNESSSGREVARPQSTSAMMNWAMTSHGEVLTGWS